MVCVVLEYLAVRAEAEAQIKGGLMRLYAVVKRGRNAGIQIEPHKYSNGKYKVRKGGRTNPYRDVDFDDLASLIRSGYGVRMSSKPHRHPPGLIQPESICGWK